MGILSKKKKIHKIKHILTAIIISMLGLMFLLISSLNGGYEWWTDILQGLGTGLITGVAVLFIGGIKNYEINKLQTEIDELQDINVALFFSLKICKDVAEHRENITNKIEKLTDCYLDLDQMDISIIPENKEAIEKIVDKLKIYIEGEGDLLELGIALSEIYEKMAYCEIEKRETLKTIKKSII